MDDVDEIMSCDEVSINEGGVVVVVVMSNSLQRFASMRMEL